MLKRFMKNIMLHIAKVYLQEALKLEDDFHRRNMISHAIGDIKFVKF